MDQSSPAGRLAVAIEGWIAWQIAERVRMEPQRIDPEQPVFRYGLDSLAAADLALAVEKELNRSLPVTMLWEQPTIRAVARYLSSELASSDPDAVEDTITRFQTPTTVTIREVAERQLASMSPGLPTLGEVAPSGGKRGFPLGEQRLAMLNERARQARARGSYFYESVIEEHSGAWVTVQGQRMLMLASYGYLGLLGHPRINQAAQAAVTKFGTGTHGGRLVSGTTSLHRKLEQTIARFKGAEAAVVFSSGYVTNLATISTLAAKDDIVICDKLDHASIIDGCSLSQAGLTVFNHNDMADLERCLQQAGSAGKLVVADAVFSMDGDIINLPEVIRLCRKYGASLMIDEAHSLGVLGKTGHGIEEHFGLASHSIDVKMGTLSKTIPSIGGYVAGNADLVMALRHNARGLIFSGALPPPQVAAAQAAFEVIESEPGRVAALQQKTRAYISGLRGLGFNTLRSETAIVPIVCRTEELTFEMTRLCWDRGLFAMPIVYPAVPIDSPRLRTTITALHSDDDIGFALSVFEEAGRKCGLI